MKRKITPLLLIAAIIIFIFSIIGCPGKKQITISKNPQPTKALETICPSASLIATITPKPTKLVENTLTPKPTYPIEVTAVPTEEPTKTPKPTNPPVFRVGYSFSETSKLKNVSFTVESFFDGAGTYDEYQVYRTENKIKIQINGDPDVLGTVQYLVPCLK